MRDLRRASAMIGALALGCVAMTGCKGTSTIGGEGGGGSSGSASGGGGSSPVSAPRKVDKVDIVLGVDNSASMADKQQVLALAMADMISSLTEPPCFDASGALVGPTNKGACSEGTHTLYAAIHDIHIGVVTSSLGGHGSDACPTSENPQHNNDAGHLIDRGLHGVVPTYQNKGFLAWDPLHKQNPPGDDDAATFTGKIRDLVAGTGQDGCGYESQLESWYRFLADPDPSATITAKGPTFVPSGTDQTLLDQRAAFLRPDSLLVIMMLSDENDCSVQESGFNPIVLNSGNSDFHLPAPRAVCATNPNDRCCGSCGIDPPAGCPVDPTCDGGRATLTDTTDPVNLRCFDQKRRFGVDFLYPIERYVSALSTTVVANRDGDLVKNPIYSRLPGQDPNAPLRDPGLVVLASIGGVPWQDVARDPNDLTKGFKDDTELSAPTVSGHTTWDEIVGDPTHSVDPKDPFMIESQKPRSGSSPFTNDAILPATSQAMNRINGHEWNTKENSNGDLEYACDFVLPTPVDCSAAGASCDCPDGTDPNIISTTDPLCSTQSVTTQVRAKAYPGLRQLAVLKGLAAQGVAASICPSNLTDSSRSDYVYRPAMRAVIERVAGRLAH